MIIPHFRVFYRRRAPKIVDTVYLRKHSYLSTVTHNVAHVCRDTIANSTQPFTVKAFQLRAAFLVVSFEMLLHSPTGLC